MIVYLFHGNFYNANYMKIKYLCIIPVLTLLCACNDTKSMMGIRKSSPDEYVVISNPPLSMPPEFENPENAKQPFFVFNDSEDELSDEDEMFLRQIQ